MHDRSDCSSSSCAHRVALCLKHLASLLLVLSLLGVVLGSDNQLLALKGHPVQREVGQLGRVPHHNQQLVHYYSRHGIQQGDLDWLDLIRIIVPEPEPLVRVGNHPVEECLKAPLQFFWLCGASLTGGHLVQAHKASFLINGEGGHGDRLRAVHGPARDSCASCAQQRPNPGRHVPSQRSVVTQC